MLYIRLLQTKDVRPGEHRKHAIAFKKEWRSNRERYCEEKYPFTLLMALRSASAWFWMATT